MALAPRTVQYMPDCLSLDPITVLHPASLLNGPDKMLVGDVPDPLGAIAEHNFLLSPAPAALPGFGVEAVAKEFGRFNGARIDGRGLIANGSGLLCRSWFG